MSKTILITGGARSGKTRLAEAEALRLSCPAVYIATAEARDDEMHARIAAHVADRGADFVTVEEPRDLTGALTRTEGQGARVIDCLTLWLTNLMLADQDWQAATDALCAALKTARDPVVMVSNEVGMGIVPDNALGRAFRDAQGMLNQRIAAEADAVYLAVSGLPLKVK